MDRNDRGILHRTRLWNCDRNHGHYPVDSMSNSPDIRNRNQKKQQWLDHTGSPLPFNSTTPEAIRERKRQALLAFSEGLNVTQVANRIGVTRWTIHDWVKRDEWFREEKARIQELFDANLASEMEELAISIAKGGDGVTKDGLPNYTAVRDILKVTNRERWGDKKEVSHTGTVVHSLIPTAKRLDQLLAEAEMEDAVIVDVPALESGEDEE